MRKPNYNDSECQKMADLFYVEESNHRSDSELAILVKPSFPERNNGGLCLKFQMIRLFLSGARFGKDKYIHIGKKFVTALMKRYDPAFIQKRIKENEKWRMKEQGIKNPRRKKANTEKKFIKGNDNN